jgi:hypothetical protein
MPSLFERVASFPGRIIAELKQIKDELAKIHTTCESAQEKKECQPVVVNAVLSGTETQEREDERHHHATEAFQDRYLFIQVVGLLITFIIAIATLFSAKAAKEAAFSSTEQAKTLRQQAEAAKGSIDATVEQFRLDERAWVSLQQGHILPPSDGEIRLKLDFINTGKTPAKDIVEADLVWIWPKPLRKGPPPSFSQQFVFLPMAPIAPQRIGTINGIGTIAKMPAYPAVTRGESILYEVGEIRYNDVFGHPHRTTFCVYQATPADQFLTNCERGNSID